MTKEVTQFSLPQKEKELFLKLNDFANPFTDIIAKSAPTDKLVLWDNIANLIGKLNKLGVISIQRTCFNCRYHSIEDKIHFCQLIDKQLQAQDIRIDCKEFELA